MKRFLFVFFLGVVMMSTSFVQASGDSLTKEDSITSPIKVSINSVGYSAQKNQIVLKITIKNNTTSFIDNVFSYLEIYKGDALQDEGYRFAGLKFMYVSKEPLNNLSPQSSQNLKIVYNIPTTLPSGKYFIRYIVKDKEMVNFGMTYSPEPILIKGDGGFIGSIIAQAEVRGIKSDLYLGVRSLKDDIISIIIPLDKNNDLVKKINQEDIYTEIAVEPIANNHFQKKVFPKEKINIIHTEQDGDILRYDIKPWSDLSTGPLNVIIRFFDEKNNLIANEISARWFRSENVIRIKEIKTETNYYKKGNKLDIQIPITLFGLQENMELISKVSVDTNRGVLNFTQKEVVDNKKDSFTFDFSKNSVGHDNIVVSGISTQLLNAKTGELIDEMKMRLNIDKYYVNGDEYLNQVQENNQQRNSQQNVIFIASAGLFVIFMVVSMFGILRFLRKKGKKIISIILIFGVNIGVGVLLFKNATKIVQANCSIRASSCADSNSTGIVKTIGTWIENAPEKNQGNCSLSKRVDIYATYSCEACLNGSPVVLGLEARYSDGSADLNVCSSHGWAVPHHETSGMYGPFTTTIPLNSQSVQYRSLVRIGAGCACAAASSESRWYSFSCTTPATCTGSLPIGATKCPNADSNLTENVAWHKVADCSGASKCSYTRKVDCGPKNNTNQTTLTSSSSGLCKAPGVVHNFDDKMTEFDGDWTWNCVKSGYDSASCLAYKFGSCAPTTSAPYDDKNDACQEGHINSVSLNNGTFSWKCGTNGGASLGSFVDISQNAQGTTINATSDTYAPTDCQCTAGYTYYCQIAPANCSNHCGEMATEIHAPFKKETACFPNEGDFIHVTRENYADNVIKHAPGEPDVCENKQVQCPPCGVNPGESGTINETN